jgi:hypothetical protein
MPITTLQGSFCINETLFLNDVLQKEESKAFSDLGTGNRVATVLFYMSQPEKGGYTVFTDIKTTLVPTFRDALFWFVCSHPSMVYDVNL